MTKIAHTQLDHVPYHIVPQCGLCDLQFQGSSAQEELLTDGRTLDVRSSTGRANKLCVYIVNIDYNHHNQQYFTTIAFCAIHPHASSDLHAKKVVNCQGGLGIPH